MVRAIFGVLYLLNVEGIQFVLTKKDEILAMEKMVNKKWRKQDGKEMKWKE